ncbi:MAG: tRNA N6-adenosine(37)-N6-threonylcarbamoyltransferase complex dimerization subunit TsaB [Verrucomicrobiales bacterium]|nr:tRNA N6-adenosine(37)-N6-threonylcarbamoyltransferase complex dimerization subunit TsaB [Verrucomicrobiales bacterium]
MKILALEFSSSQRSFAILDSETNRVAGSAAEMGGRSTRAFALIEQALQKANLTREQIDCLAIGIGPGSYAGIRSAIALAQGWQMARDVKLIGLSSVETIASGLQHQRKFGRTNVVIDAQRNEFYLATYEISASMLKESEALRIVSADEIRSRIEAGQTVVGPELEKWFPQATLVYPEAGITARLATMSKAFVSGDKIEPIYLRETTFVKAPPSRIIP